MIKLKRIFTALFIIISLFIVPFTASAEDYNCAEDIHKYIVTETPATATEDGSKRFTCALCGYSFSEIILASEHTWGPWVIDRKATCTTDGMRHRDCTRGTPHTEHDIIKALGHDYRITEKLPTCTDKGMKTYTCNRCGDSYKEQFGEPTGHSYIETVTTEPTPDAEGVKTFTCEYCGDSYTEPIASLDHSHDYVLQSETKPSCETDGIKLYKCKTCESTYSETVAPVGHNYGEWIVDNHPNLTEEGRRHKICNHDSSHIIYETIPKAITLEVTPATAATSSSAFILFFISMIILVSDYKIIMWDRRKRKEKWKEIEERRKQE